MKTGRPFKREVYGCDGIDISITSRQKTVIDAIVSGLTYKEVAESLVISFQTVRNHIFQASHENGLGNEALLSLWANYIEDENYSVHKFTEAETKILELMSRGEGASYKEISRELGISKNTIGNTLINLKRKISGNEYRLNKRELVMIYLHSKRKSQAESDAESDKD